MPAALERKPSRPRVPGAGNRVAATRGIGRLDQYFSKRAIVARLSKKQKALNARIGEIQSELDELIESKDDSNAAFNRQFQLGKQIEALQKQLFPINDRLRFFGAGGIGKYERTKKIIGKGTGLVRTGYSKLQIRQGASATGRGIGSVLGFGKRIVASSAKGIRRAAKNAVLTRSLAVFSKHRRRISGLTKEIRAANATNARVQDELGRRIEINANLNAKVLSQWSIIQNIDAELTVANQERRKLGAELKRVSESEAQARGLNKSILFSSNRIRDLANRRVQAAESMLTNANSIATNLTAELQSLRKKYEQRTASTKRAIQNLAGKKSAIQEQIPLLTSKLGDERKIVNQLTAEKTSLGTVIQALRDSKSRAEAELKATRLQLEGLKKISEGTGKEYVATIHRLQRRIEDLERASAGAESTIEKVEHVNGNIKQTTDLVTAEMVTTQKTVDRAVAQDINTRIRTSLEFAKSHNSEISGSVQLAFATVSTRLQSGQIEHGAAVKCINEIQQVMQDLSDGKINAHDSQGYIFAIMNRIGSPGK